MQTAVQVAKVWIGGKWREADAASVFQTENPSTGKKIDRDFPVSRWSDCDAALDAAVEAAHVLEQLSAEKIAGFLEAYAAGIDSAKEAIVAAAHEETGLSVSPRLRDGELPRTADQLRQAATAARQQTWRHATIDRQRNIRSCCGPIGPVVIFDPNNFPLAFNSVSGGDFASAIVAGNPVIAKAHPLHPYTTALLAEQAERALASSGLPPATVQMVFHVEPETGLRLVSDPRVGAISFTGSREAGLRLKAAADAAGKPIYLEMSSLNPVVFLPQGLKENTSKWAGELVDSCTASSGQQCTRPNLVFLTKGEAVEPFLTEVGQKFKEREPHAMLSGAVRERFHQSIEGLRKAGAELVVGGENLPGPGYRHANTLLRINGDAFLSSPEHFLQEAFGNETMAVVVDNEQELLSVLEHLEGNLTASVYSSTSGGDDALYGRVAPLLRRRSGRFLNDKMPTGVAVSAAMNHGGPYPATGHPGFTAVGMPTSITRFATLQCYDNVREERLPAVLRGE